MSSSFLFASGLGIPVLVAYWIGVVYFGKVARDSSFWLMLTGVTLSTLGAIATPLILLLRYIEGSGIDMLLRLLPVTSGVSGLGALVFAVGFAIRAAKSGRASQRVRELEAVIEAQNEQLSRQGS